MTSPATKTVYDTPEKKALARRLGPPMTLMLRIKEVELELSKISVVFGENKFDPRDMFRRILDLQRIHLGANWGGYVYDMLVLCFEKANGHQPTTEVNITRWIEKERRLYHSERARQRYEERMSG